MCECVWTLCEERRIIRPSAVFDSSVQNKLFLCILHSGEGSHMLASDESSSMSDIFHRLNTLPLPVVLAPSQRAKNTLSHSKTPQA